MAFVRKFSILAGVLAFVAQLLERMFVRRCQEQHLGRVQMSVHFMSLDPNGRGT